MLNNLALLASVEKPGRYTGGEFNSIVKNKAEVEVSFALAFPDIYEVGMSYLGYKILYHLLNELSYVQAERVYSPWPDMEKLMREQKIKLSSLETNKELNQFDLVGITLQYELSYSNILNLLDLAAIPVYSSERQLEDPFVAAGGPCVYNPEPLADFFDFFIIGEGEEVIVELAEAYRLWKKANKPGGRAGFLEQISHVAGIYIPSFYQPLYEENGRFAGLKKLNPLAPDTISKRLVKDLNTISYPTAPIVPYIESVHDRIMLEVFRGCTRGCRFCQAGMIYRPVRERRQEKLEKLARELVDNTGYNEMSLFSLSTADYSKLSELLDNLISGLKEERVSVSLPSLRIDSFCVGLAEKVQQVRKSGLTFAPEAGTQRMRDIINKGVTEEDLLSSVSAAFVAGWSSVKLYFMLGLPGETRADIKGIADLAYKVFDCYQAVTGKRNCKITVSVSCFVPKAWTPFQWAMQDTLEMFREKQQYLKSLIKNKAITYQYHDAQTSILEGVFARGDRRLGRVLYNAWQKGARFDGWSECFDYKLWQTALAENGVSLAYANQYTSDEQATLPWDHLQPGVSREFLWQEYQKASQEELTVDCRRGNCQTCGVCPALEAQIIDYASRGDL